MWKCMCYAVDVTLFYASSIFHCVRAHPSDIHYLIPCSKLTFSTNRFHQCLLAPNGLTHLLADFILLNGFIFCFLSFFLIFVSVWHGRLSWLHRQLSSAVVVIINVIINIIIVTGVNKD